ncbi:RIP metalloprotease RseP [Novosphingobium sp. 9]|uniref:RIP metalloprotease RseP n=1 Tax=Novosphingobium sp. 9 TaxID=2025349 RepID=UPI0021B6265F|nr:RIP metalloprotease RseP [Novosphingobium sp. 9]
MTSAPGLLTTVFAFALVLGPLVLFHELGHYLVGRLFGVKADAFSIGFGREIVGWTDKRGTRWKLSILPLGGYVQFAGDMNPSSAPSPREDGLTPAERARTFHAKPLWQRSLIVLAGPMTNLMLAIAVFAAFNYGYGRVEADPVVLGFAQHSDARDAGLRVGDRVLAVDGQKVASFTDIAPLVAPYPGRTLPLAIERDGRDFVLPVHLSAQEVSDQFGNVARVADLGVDYMPAVIGRFSKDSPAEYAGMQIGDRIVAVDGSPVRSFMDLIDAVSPNPGRTVNVVIDRSGQSMAMEVHLEAASALDEQGRRITIGRLGIANSPGRIVPVGAFEAVGLASSQSVSLMRTMLDGIGQIVTGERSVKELGGPIKIAKYSGEQFSLGWPEFVNFVALISINLAFINLLPIPGLDGGHLAFYVAEFVRRRPLGARSQEWAIRTGVMLVLALMLFVTVNDLASLPIFGG